MYAMWWHKPLAPNEPLILKGDWVDPLYAFMFMTSEVSGTVDGRSIKSHTSLKTMFAFLHLYSKEPEIETLCLYQLAPNPEADSLDATSSSAQFNMVDMETFSSGQEGISSYQKQLHAEFAIASSTCHNELRTKRRETAAGTAFFERRPRVIGYNLALDSVDGSKRRRWELAAAATRDYPVVMENHVLYAHGEQQCIHFSSEELLVARLQNWPWDDLLRDIGGLVVGLVLWLANFGYGAIHAAA